MKNNRIRKRFEKVIWVYNLYRRNGSVREELNVKTPVYAVKS